MSLLGVSSGAVLVFDVPSKGSNITLSEVLEEHTEAVTDMASECSGSTVMYSVHTFFHFCGFWKLHNKIASKMYTYWRFYFMQITFTALKSIAFSVILLPIYKSTTFYSLNTKYTYDCDANVSINLLPYILLLVLLSAVLSATHVCYLVTQ